MLSRSVKTLHSTALIVAFTRISRFELCFLTGRNKMLVLLKVLDNFFRHYFAFKTTQSILD